MNDAKCSDKEEEEQDGCVNGYVEGSPDEKIEGISDGEAESTVPLVGPELELYNAVFDAVRVSKCVSSR